MRLLRRRMPTPLQSDERAFILAFHRVTDAIYDSEGIAITPERFQTEIESLVGNRHVVRLEDLKTEIARGSRNLAVVTFDDGYLDVLVNAVPVLERYACPATVFVTTDAVGAPREFWWDEITRIVTESKAPLHALMKAANSRSAGNSTRRFLRRKVKSHFVRDRPAYCRAFIFDSVWRDSPGDRASRLHELAEFAGVDLTPRDTHRAVNLQELHRLARHPLIDIGAHGVTHRSLAQVGPDDARFEIFESKSRCEAMTGEPVCTFAYPFGHANSASRRLAVEAGYRLACSIDAGFVTAASDPFWLPRIEIRNGND